MVGEELADCARLEWNAGLRFSKLNDKSMSCSNAALKVEWLEWMRAWDTAVQSWLIVNVTRFGASRVGASERNAHSRKASRSFRDHRVRPLFLATIDTFLPTYLSQKPTYRHPEQPTHLSKWQLQRTLHQPLTLARMVSKLKSRGRL